MNFPRWRLTVRPFVVAASAMLVVLANSLNTSSQTESGSRQAPDAELAGFSALAPIDAHIHLYQDNPAFGRSHAAPESARSKHLRY